MREFFAKAISAKEELECVRSRKNQFPAFPKDLNFSRDRPGLPYRSYGENSGNSYRMEAR